MIINGIGVIIIAYVSTQEIAEEWEISERRVTTLCSDGRILGAKMVGHSWIIPSSATKPVDARIKSGKYIKAQCETTRKKIVSPIDDHLNQIFEADCLEKMKDFPSQSIDMILCDLPYGITQNKWDSYIPLDQLWQEYNRIIKPNGAVVLTSSGIFTAMLIMSQVENFKYKWVWEKSKSTNFLNAKKQPLRKYEEICVFYKKQPTYNPQMTQGEAYDKGIRKNQLSGSYGDFSPVHVKSDGERYPTDVIYFKTAESEGDVFHPTQKPVSLGEYLIKTYTNEGDIVLDNACGSGSFLVAALNQGRNFIGIEKNENSELFKKEEIDYIKVSKDRLNASWKKLTTKEKNRVKHIGLFEESGKKASYERSSNTSKRA